MVDPSSVLSRITFAAICTALVIFLPGCISVVDRSQDKTIRVEDSGRSRAFVQTDQDVRTRTTSVRAGAWCYVEGIQAPPGRVHADFESEVDAVFDRIAEELARTGHGLPDVVSINVFIRDLQLHYDRFLAVYDERFSTPRPVMSCVGVAELPASALIQISAVARTRPIEKDHHREEDGH